MKADMVEQAKQVILEFLESQENCTVSFAELEGLLEQRGLVYGDPENEYTIEIKKYNFVLWASNNKLLIDAVISLREEGRISFEPTSFLVYAADGVLLTLPLVKRAKKYKRPHWLPVVICLEKNADR